MSIRLQLDLKNKSLPEIAELFDELHVNASTGLITFDEVAESLKRDNINIDLLRETLEALQLLGYNSSVIFLKKLIKTYAELDTPQQNPNIDLTADIHSLAQALGESFSNPAALESYLQKLSGKLTNIKVHDISALPIKLYYKRGRTKVYAKHNTYRALINFEYDNVIYSVAYNPSNYSIAFTKGDSTIKYFEASSQLTPAQRGSSPPPLYRSLQYIKTFLNMLFGINEY